MVSWHGSIVLRTLLRLKELVWRLDHWVGFRDCFKNRARHLLWTKPALTAVTTAAWPGTAAGSPSARRSAGHVRTAVLC